ncbi:MAG: photosystem II biosynthesis protein, partial [Cyanobacteriota bacterium]|nr:photosystem II biosynthesis protein [Cyanobacteriota bacterium]
GFCFLLGLGGLSYGVLSASWEANDGSLLGLENIRTNLDRMRSSIRAQKQNRSN